MDVTNTTSWESNPIYITKCTISSNSTSGTTGSTGNGGGIYLLRGIFNVNGCTINNNVSNSNTTTDNNGGGGIFIPYSAGTALYLLNSTLKGNVIGTGKNVGSAINTDIQSTLVRNCLITGNTGSTFHTQGAARQCTYQNCTLAGNVTSTGSEAGLNLGWQVGAISTFTNCIFYKSSTNPISGTINANMDPVVMYCGFDLAAVPATYATKTGCITGLTAASFTDAANGDWSLSPTSAAINAGTTIPAVTTDISGTNLRPQGSAYDMGAYETPSAISSFTPTSGASGATVTITGSNLTGTTAVSFGGVAASSFTVNSDTQITATVGLGGTGNVSVTTPGGIGTLAGFTCTGYLPAPVITLFSPTTGASNTTVTITGLNLTGATAVSFGGTAAKSFTVNSDTKITAVTNSASVGIVSVTTPSGTASLGVPTITSFTPTTAGNGASVVITGTYLTGTSVVKFGGTAPISYIVNSDTQITATVGSTVSGSVSVTTPLGTGTLAGFTYSSPVISSFTPPVGGSGNSVVITGTGFTGVTAVSFGGTAATTYNIDSDTQITATVGASASGSVTVSTAIGTNSKSGFTWISSPTIYKAGTATAFTTTYGTTSTIQSFTVGGVRLTANVTATAPAGFEVSSDGTTYGSTATFTQTSGYASGTLRIRLTASAGVSGTYNAKNIVLSSTSATAVNITTAASGNAVSAKALTITATGPTKIYGTALSVGTSTSNFTTNGAEVSGETVTSITLTPDAAGLSATTAVGAPYVVTPSLATGTGSFLASNYNVTYNVYNGTVSAVPPTITSFTPTTAGSGTSVVITGTNLTAASAVSFGGTAATSFVVNSATQITAVVGSGSTGSVSVTTPGGTATKTGFSSTVTGIENTEDANLSLSVYKNATGQIIVNRDGTIGSEGMITIYNVMGNKLVHICTTGKMTVINNSFGSGIYLVSIDVAGKNITRKVIIH